MRKKTILICLCATIVVIACTIITVSSLQTKELPVVSVEANSVVFDTEDEMYEYVDLVVIGSVKTNLEDDVAYFEDPDGDGFWDWFYTESDLYVEKVLKGDCNEEVITLLQPVAIGTDKRGERFKAVFDKCPELEKNKTYVLYLCKLSDRYLQQFGEYTYGPASYMGVIDLKKDLTPPKFPELKGDESELDRVAQLTYREELAYYNRVSKLKAGAINRFRDDIKEVTGLEFKDTSNQ